MSITQTRKYISLTKQIGSISVAHVRTNSKHSIHGWNVGTENSWLADKLIETTVSTDDLVNLISARCRPAVSWCSSLKEERHKTYSFTEKHSPSSFFQAWDWHSIMDFATQPDIVGLCAAVLCCGGVKSVFRFHSFLVDSCFTCQTTWCSCQWRRHKSVSSFCRWIHQSSSFAVLQFQFSVSSYLFV